MSQRKVLIIGGVAGGASCAARLRRLDEHTEITLVERGPYISFANCGLPYHIGGIIPDRQSLLVQTAESFERRFAVRVLPRTEAIAIDRARKSVRLRGLDDDRSFELFYDQLVLSPGAEPLRPPIPGIDLPGIFTLRNIPDLDRIMDRILSRAAEAGRHKPRSAIVVGAGFIGIETAENLRHLGLAVTVIELANQIMPLLDPEMAAPLAGELALNGVDVRTGVSVQRFAEKEGRLSLSLSSGDTLTADLVVVATGVRPETTLAKDAGLPLGKTGGIQVDRQMRTEDPSIFAVGDAVEITDRTTGLQGRVSLAGPANRQGRLVADILSGREESYRGALGTSIVKVFSMAAASVGMTEKQAEKMRRTHDLSYRVAWVHGQSHASYYPAATPLTLKMLFESRSGQVLGAQVVGKEGVDKRVDVLAMAIAGKMSVFDLETMDFAYAPPFSSAKDPVNHLAAVAAGMIRGDHPAVSWNDVEAARAEGDFLIDVRTPSEFRCGTIDGATNIPLDELRNRLQELPKGSRLLVFCQIGLRGYLAARLLLQHGFRVRNLLGGYKLWRSVRERPQPVESGDPPMEQSMKHEEKKLAVAMLDVSGLACPGPILRTKTALDGLQDGEVIEIIATDPGFASDLPAWTKSTGHQLLGIRPDGNRIVAQVRKQTKLPASSSGGSCCDGSAAGDKSQALVVFSGDLDRALAAMIIATGGASMGRSVTLFFTFWGLNLLRKDRPPKVKKDLVSRMFGMMMPRGAARARLSKLHLGGMGTWMMQLVMKQKNVHSLPALLKTAQDMGVKLVACQMSMDVMGITKDELIEGVEIGGVASFLAEADGRGLSLFI